jgi:hypothetical protein
MRIQKSVRWEILVVLATVLVAIPLAAAAAGPAEGIPLRPLQAGYCFAVAPPDWQVTNTDPKGTMLELHNGTFAAFYNILGVDGMTMQGLPGFGHPSLVVQRTAMAGLGGEPMQQMTQPMPFGDMYVQEFESATFHVLAMYRVYPMPMGGYVVLMRIASGPRQLWPQYGAIAVNVASSTRCRAQLTPAGGSDGGSLSPRSAESTYNAQLGTEYAHDPATGELYLMEHASDWWEAGPDGPGYYKALPGGGHRKLSPGLQP